MTFDTDVLIIGGGPAGASTALSILNETDLEVLIIEQSDFSKTRVGEQVSSSITDFLDYLKLDVSDFDSNCFIPSYGDISYWGSDVPTSRSSLFTASHSSLQLQRDSFESVLIEKVAERGGQVLPRTKCTGMVQNETGYWEVEAKHVQHGSIHISARFLVDATGRKASIARKVGAPSKKWDNLIGVGAFLTFAEDEILAKESLIEATELGWWYAAVLPENIMTLVLFSDADIIAKHDLTDPVHWNKAIAATNRLKLKVLGATSLHSVPWVRNAFSQITDVSSTKNFIATGDAAISFDPISSMGIGFAISSGCQAARIISLQLEAHNPKTIEMYQEDINAHYASYLKLRAQFYQKEARWPMAPFWQRRRKDP